jgi:hypothetical protein
MDSDVGRRECRPEQWAGIRDCRPRHDCDVDLHALSARRTGADAQGMPSRIVLRSCFDANAIVGCPVLSMLLCVRGQTMLVRGWTVVMIRVIVVGVHVHVQGRGRRHGQDQGLHENGGDQAPHGGQSTTPRAARPVEPGGFQV